ncbi:LOW QUALITY PROTEIN: uncharacterized protein LOC111829394 [Capsella rubella]|uniref:LOW QUALITY PROTEIN: uncharacterized protein LOC111829394 n=1 Tax=Capsella rubella TaxID=81985 RepID=UPI000CD5B3B6|nr:LOW QUALITY PROTEIN: uncharacterized protein LOC111829394 [Capsella rubella]
MHQNLNRITQFRQEQNKKSKPVNLLYKKMKKTNLFWFVAGYDESVSRKVIKFRYGSFGSGGEETGTSRRRRFPMNGGENRRKIREMQCLGEIDPARLGFAEIGLAAFFWFMTYKSGISLL